MYNRVMTRNEEDLIQFVLTPIEDIGAWGAAEAPNLHWFGLSDGFYWLHLGDEELFRFSDSFLERYPDEPPPALPYVDYYVVRLHEDLLEMLPDVLEPIPADLADLVGDADRASALKRTADRWDEEHCTADDFEVYVQAVTWWGERSLRTNYLVYPPRIDIWRVGDTVSIRWDNREHLDDDIPIWSAQAGELSMHVDAFLAAVRSFDERFMAAMRCRVAAAETDWPRPDIFTDPKALQAEQVMRERGLAIALAQGPKWSDWETIRRAITIVREG